MIEPRGTVIVTVLPDAKKRTPAPEARWPNESQILLMLVRPRPMMEVAPPDHDELAVFLSFLDITPARKFRMLLHINPTRQRGKRTGSLAALRVGI